MSRINDYEPDSLEEQLRCYAFSANIKRALKGRKGQAFLRELEAALVALPEKRLVRGVFAEADELPVPTTDPTFYRAKVVATGEVCALGAVAVERAVRKGMTREEACQKYAEQFDPEENDWILTQEQGKELGICHPLAYEIIYHNDESCARTPEDRYEEVLRWVRSQIIPEPQGGSGA